MSDANVDARLAALESKLGRLEDLLSAVNDKPRLGRAERRGGSSRNPGVG
jgi:hypothetical protein